MTTAFAERQSLRPATLPAMGQMGDSRAGHRAGASAVWAAYQGFCWEAFNLCWSGYVKDALAELNRQIAAAEVRVPGKMMTTKSPRHLTASRVRTSALLAGAWLESPMTVARSVGGPVSEAEEDNRQAIGAILMATADERPVRLSNAGGLPVMDHLAQVYARYGPARPNPDLARYIDTVRRFADAGKAELADRPGFIAPNPTIRKRYLTGQLPKSRHLYERLNATMEAFFADEYAKLASISGQPGPVDPRPVPFINHLPWWNLRRPNPGASSEDDYAASCSARSAQWFVDFRNQLEAKGIPTDVAIRLSAERDKWAVARRMSPSISVEPAVAVVPVAAGYGMPSEAVSTERGFIAFLAAFRRRLVDASGEYYAATNFGQLRDDFEGNGEVARTVERFLQWLADPKSVAEWQLVQQLRLLPERTRPIVYLEVMINIWRQVDYLVPGGLLGWIDSDIHDDGSDRGSGDGSGRSDEPGEHEGSDDE